MLHGVERPDLNSGRRGVAIATSQGLGLEEVLQALAGTERLAALSGVWNGGRPVVAYAPDRVATTLQELDELPVVPGCPESGHGAWIGALGYQLNRQLRAQPPRIDLPDGAISMAYYPRYLSRAEPGGSWLVFGGCAGERRCAHCRAYLDDLAVRLGDGGGGMIGFQCGRFGVTPTLDEHERLVAEVVDRIRRGELLQANLCLALEASFDGSAVSLFGRAVDELGSPYAAYLETPTRTVASLSPELYLSRVASGTLASEPIKGTAAVAEADRLADSVKDVAENLMITDLMRNDLGRVCRPGSIAFSPIEQRPLAGVRHLVSRVSGESVGNEVSRALAATFPAGSITGAPKLRAMRLIDQLEVVPRDGYTGSIGWIGERSWEFNVAIRTFEISGGRIRLGVGGGITHRSNPRAESLEILTKADPILAAIGADYDVPPERRQLHTTSATVRLHRASDGGCRILVTDHGLHLVAEPNHPNAVRLRRELARRGFPVWIRHQVTLPAAEIVADVELGRDGEITPYLASPVLERWLTECARWTPSSVPSPSSSQVLIIDNYDSFTYNLADYCKTAVRSSGVRVIRNDELGVDACLGLIEENHIERVIVSPGPGDPQGAGICVDLLRRLPAHVSALGVCLGHQCVAEAFGARVGTYGRPAHGVSSPVVADGTGSLAGCPDLFLAGRYHSLSVDPGSVTATPLVVTAQTVDGEIMGLRHRRLPIEGVQFHPESLLTTHGRQLIETFLADGPRPPPRSLASAVPHAG